MTATAQTAVKKRPDRKRPPAFYTDVEVDISPHELEEAGWVYVGDQGEGDHEKHVPNSAAFEAVRTWHHREHEQPWSFCDHDLCRDLRGMTL